MVRGRDVMVAGVESGGEARWWPASKAEGGVMVAGVESGGEARWRGQARSGEVAARRLARRSKCRRLASREDLRSSEVRRGQARSWRGQARSRQGQARSRPGQARSRPGQAWSRRGRPAAVASNFPSSPNLFFFPKRSLYQNPCFFSLLFWEQFC
ncbi:hypothetical protein LR48_Vigan04g100300 [Vigna angularis]|uniref:Uncharacterized protein n=1 Tax=Phaseolus angularis TaxID=3914 RepID=A0A0L9UCZ3_PHAAN|nr:hypothetical protein LR48_Vigan04g100300 [Vigna angularis]